MPAPYHFWLKYLLSKGMSNDEVREFASTQGLYGVSLHDVEVAEAELQKGKPLVPKFGVPATSKWLRNNRIYSMWDKTDTMAQASIAVLVDPPLRRLMEGMLLGKIPPERISEAVKDLCGSSPHPTQVSFYKHYFWNVPLLDSAQWFAFLGAHPNREEYWQAYNSEVNEVLWTFGVPVTLAENEIISEMVTDSFMRFKQTKRMNNNFGTAQTAKFWAEIVFEGLESMSKGDSAFGRQLEILREASIRLGTRDIASLEDLSGGNDSEAQVIDITNYQKVSI